MDFLSLFLMDFVKQLQSPTLSFLIGGMVIAALGSQLQIPESICKIIVFMLLTKIGLTGGMAIRNSNLTEMVLPVTFSIVLGILIVFIARYTLGKLPKVKAVDAIATGGLFGAVSGSTMAAALTVLEEQNIQYEAWAGALYPFMDIPALVTAIVIANIYLNRKKRKAADEYPSKQEYVGTAGEYIAPAGAALSTAGAPLPAGTSFSTTGDYPNPAGDYPTSRQEYRRKQQGHTDNRVKIWPIVQESLQGPALSAMLLGLALGLLAQPESVYKSFYDPLFRGLLSILMLVMGMEAWSRIGELRKVAQWYVVYSVVAPLLHGFIAFGLGMIAHYTTGFSLGGVVILAVIAASSSDISGPPTLRAGIPSANPSAYIGASTAIGTPIAIGVAIPLFLGLAQAISGI
ncbi:sodium-dependent bicarbonate transport family permease [Desertifilum sp. FACHB-1129]|uniref:Sodium-dependent bicarbonate transport family permease n=1 Tax=Desertifilum tharense IPPAS B-1220 TaxID=1781255 RepID=A0A1E5QPR4_9CYAN|nr:MULTISPECIES: sodium-dependent bicarbonate transport family permease [Desertifilum]MDA0209380.1 sodium-dependent bicarbonate transport family permease [Cyanobacteria bacterium FC1]MBD2311654.1 sodium-dependent bicarbonate transport family permease [Desertifilum sp. FACHB-1129]MBD2322821.1 sodium-dependent bicarbonate transport family permease [Desertifilum sp. FACHB-866]MBD2332785.1 sodium-dependent bicarbonate transport family permease [Desertifilum sp. FACHB-868]OEJ76343.1 sodium-dependen